MSMRKYGSNQDQRVTQDPGPGKMPEEPEDLAQKTASLQPEPAMTKADVSALMQENYRDDQGYYG